MPMPDVPSAAPCRLEAGARVGGKYRLARRIAVGGMGEVWRAEHQLLARQAAIKLVRRHGRSVKHLRFEESDDLGGEHEADL